MIVLDTNVLSEVMRPRPEPTVARWLAAQPSASLFTTTISEAEIRYGLALLPASRRRVELDKAVQAMFAEDFADRILPFDSAAAVTFAAIAAARRKSGRAIGEFDAQIAAIACSRGAAVATRNVGDFVDCGIAVIDPWSR